jgi:hypothetical protein
LSGNNVRRQAAPGLPDLIAGPQVNHELFCALWHRYRAAA